MSPDAHSINLAEHIYDYLSLLVPIRVIHADDENGISTCDPEFLKRIESASAPGSAENSDPRWDALRNIKKN